MKDTDVLEAVSARYARVRCDRPVDAVIRRGRLLRRRRRAPAVAALALALTGGLLTLGAQPRSGAAFADWTSGPQATDAVTLAVIDASCRDKAEDATAAMPPLRIVDRRGNFALSLYTDGRSAVVCELFEGGGRSTWAQGGLGYDQEVRTRHTLSPARPVAVESAGQITLAAGQDSASNVYGWVGPGVVKVVVTSSVATVTASVNDGAFTAWWPDAGQPSGRATVTAYDSAGKVAGTTDAVLPSP